MSENKVFIFILEQFENHQINEQKMKQNKTFYVKDV